MKLLIYIALSILLESVTNLRISKNLRRDLISVASKNEGNPSNEESNIEIAEYKANSNFPNYNLRKDSYYDKPTQEDIKRGKIKKGILKKARKKVIIPNIVSMNQDPFVGTSWNSGFFKDPILNDVRRSWFRRKEHYGIPKFMKTTPQPNETDSQSSDREFTDWEKEWNHLWMVKKQQALLAKADPPRGDVVNMAAAGKFDGPCGDPDQHDMPWGSCVLEQQCEAENRIYRGDVYCGRTRSICCAVQINNYDMFHGNDYVSLEDKGLLTDTEELRDKRQKAKTSARDKLKNKRKREARRYRRKKKLRKSIINTIKEIKKILLKLYKNSTEQAKQRTKQLKTYIEKMKKQYKKDRQAMQDIHNEEMVKIDKALQDKLLQIRNVNTEFFKNTTFRDILINGTINFQGARMLVEAYPELYNYIPRELRNRDILRIDLKPPTRRKEENRPSLEERPRDGNLDYDIEYGYFYF